MKPDTSNLPLPGSLKSLLNSDEMVGATPVFGSSPQGKKPKSQSGVASFLSGAALPARENVSGKTLTGQ